MWTGLYFLRIVSSWRVSWTLRWKVRFQVLKAASMKITVFCDVEPCSLVEVCRRFRGASCLHHQGRDDGGSKHLWNVGKLLSDYTAQCREDSHLHGNETWSSIKRVYCLDQPNSYKLLQKGSVPWSEFISNTVVGLVRRLLYGKSRVVELFGWSYEVKSIICLICHLSPTFQHCTIS
jgi:hypothetical protein